jgi:hypothetical protein
MRGEILVAEFGSQREIGRWSVWPYPFVRRIQHPEIAKAGANFIIVRKISPRALTVRVELSVQLSLYEGRLVERPIVQMEPNSVYGYVRVKGDNLWFPPIFLDPSSLGKGVSEWSRLARKYATDLWIESKISERASLNVPITEGATSGESLFGQALKALEQANTYLKALEEFSASPPEVNSDEIDRLFKTIVRSPGLAIIYRVE